MIERTPEETISLALARFFPKAAKLQEASYAVMDTLRASLSGPVPDVPGAHRILVVENRELVFSDAKYVPEEAARRAKKAAKHADPEPDLFSSAASVPSVAQHSEACA